MYTECPECHVAFRVTAKILQQANGNVRCGSCNHAFNALAFLSEEMPDRSSHEGPDQLEETNRRLLETLDDLAGPADVRIEDTGVEWRVLESADAGAVMETRQEVLRYDDDTPLPEEFADEEDEPYVPPAPQQQRDERPSPGGEFDSRQRNLALSDPEDWTDLLDEFRDPDPDILEVEEEMAAIHTQLTVRDETAARDRGEEPDAADVHVGDVDFELTSAGQPADEFDLDLVIAETGSGVDAVLDDGGAEPDLILDTWSAEADPVLADNGHDITAGADAPESADEPEDLAIADDERDSAFSGEELAATDHGDRPEAMDDADDSALARDIAKLTSMGVIDYAGDSEPLADEQKPEARDVAETSADVIEVEYGAAPAPTAGTTPERPEADTAAPEAAVDEFPDAPVLTVQADGTEVSEPEKENPDLYVPPATEEEMTVNMEIDQELLAAAVTDADTDDEFSATLVGTDRPEDIFEKNPEDVETIIMEGEFIRTAMDQQRLADDQPAEDTFGEPESLADTYALTRNRGGRRWRFKKPGLGMSLLTILLTILLGLQYVHYSRKSLATYGFFNQTIGPVYRVLGMPVTPEWDIRGWRFESTSGSVNDDETELTIVSRIGNRSAKPLPYPLIHVSLTDRFEDIMGSRMLEPGEYLAGDADPSRPLPSGDDFTAIITIQDPSAEATGFKLNVCYRVTQGTVRCAIEDFKH